MNIPIIVCWLCHVQIPGFHTVQMPPNATYTGPAAHYYFGYSQGCTGLRNTLMSGRIPLRGILTTDGTHSSWPMDTQHLRCWEKIAEDCEIGLVRWHTQWLDNHRYMEHAAPGAYASTASVMRRALGLDEAAPNPVDRPTDFLLGSHLRATAYPCQRMDAAAHQALGVRVKDFARELVEREYALDEPESTLALSLCKLAGQDMALGLAEVTGAADDPDILALGKWCKRGGYVASFSLAVPGFPYQSDTGGSHAIWQGGDSVALVHDETAWCAVWATSLYGRVRPHFPQSRPTLSPRISVREVCEDASAAGRLILVGDDIGDWSPMPGDFAIEARGDGNPLRGGEGHIRLITAWNGWGSNYAGIGGNESNALTSNYDGYAPSKLLAVVNMQGAGA